MKYDCQFSIEQTVANDQCTWSTQCMNNTMNKVVNTILKNPLYLCSVHTVKTSLYNRF